MHRLPLSLGISALPLPPLSGLRLFPHLPHLHVSVSWGPDRSFALRQQRGPRHGLVQGAAGTGPCPGAGGNMRRAQSTLTSAAASAPATLPELVEDIENKELHMEASESYLAYAMSVIVGRALPDARDGLKPVHRRLLYAMHDLGLTANKPFKKCARVVGEVLGKYHPHGDTAVYDALVRLAQDFSMRDPLISGHGNFGSLDDDPAAAMRYTECRLRSLSSDALLADLELDTVDFMPTFDASQDEPSVLPAKVPLLLINGSSGIAVGIATRIPPHNMREVVDGLIAMIHNPNISSQELMHYIPAPDFPTGGTVIVNEATAEAYTSGKGHVTIRAKVLIEDPDSALDSTAPSKRGSKKGGTGTKPAASEGRQLLVISEVPYQSSKAEIVQRIAELVEDKTLEGVSDVRDESDREGMRLVIELKRHASPPSVLSQLYKHTRLEAKFPCNMVALIGSSPHSMGLKEMLRCFLDFRCEVVLRRARFLSAKAEQRLHLVQGYLQAMGDMDAVVQAIRSAPDGAAAKQSLISGFALSPEQAEGVLSLTLRRLTALEKEALEGECRSLEAQVQALMELMLDSSKVLEVVEREAKEVAAKHGTPRRSIIVQGGGAQAGDDVDADLLEEDEEEELQAPPQWRLLLSKKGFLQRLPLAPADKGGRAGSSSLGLRPGDVVAAAATSRDRDPLLLISTGGKAFLTHTAQVPEGSSSKSSGAAVAQVLGSGLNIPLAALLPLPTQMRRAAAACVEQAAGASKQSSSQQGSSGEEAGQAAAGEGAETVEEQTRGQEGSEGAEPTASGSTDQVYLLLVTKSGTIKRTLFTSKFLKISKAGMPVTKVQAADPVCSAALCREGDTVLLACSDGHVLLFPVGDVAIHSRAAQGVKGMKVPEGESVVSMSILPAAPAANSTAAGAAEAGREQWLLVVMSTGHNKRVQLSEFKPQGRGGAGVLCDKRPAPAAGDKAKTKSKAEEAEAEAEDTPDVKSKAKSKSKSQAPVSVGDGSSSGVEGLVAALLVQAGDEVLLGTQAGKSLRLKVNDVEVKKRTSRGAKLLGSAAAAVAGEHVQTAVVLTSSAGPKP